MRIDGRVCVTFEVDRDTGETVGVLTFTSLDGSESISSSPFPCSPGTGMCISPVCIDCDPRADFTAWDQLTRRGTPGLAHGLAARPAAKPSGAAAPPKKV